MIDQGKLKVNIYFRVSSIGQNEYLIYISDFEEKWLHIFYTFIKNKTMLSFSVKNTVFCFKRNLMKRWFLRYFNLGSKQNNYDWRSYMTTSYFVLQIIYTFFHLQTVFNKFSSATTSFFTIDIVKIKYAVDFLLIKLLNNTDLCPKFLTYIALCRLSFILIASTVT